MFVQLPKNETLEQQIREFLIGGNDTFRERLISLLLRLPPEQWETLEHYAQELVDARTVPAFAPVQDNETSVEPEPDVTEDERLAKIMTMDMGEMTEEEFGLFMRELRRQAIEEKKAEENARASQAVTWRRKEA